MKKEDSWRHSRVLSSGRIMDLDLTWMIIVIVDAEAGQMCDCNLWTLGTDTGFREPLASVAPEYIRDAPGENKGT